MPRRTSIDVPVLSRFGAPDPVTSATDTTFEYEDVIDVPSYKFEFPHLKAMLCFPILTDMPTTHVSVVKNGVLRHEETIKQTCEHGCNARDIYERMYNHDANGKTSTRGAKMALDKANSYVHRSRVYLRSTGTSAALPRLQAQPGQIVFVVAHSANIQLHTTRHGEYVKSMADPYLTSFTPKNMQFLPMSYDEFAKCWFPQLDKAMLDANFTVVNTVRVLQLHQHLPCMPTRVQLSSFHKGLGPIPPLFVPIMRIQHVPPPLLQTPAPLPLTPAPLPLTPAPLLASPPPLFASPPPLLQTHAPRLASPPLLASPPPLRDHNDPWLSIEIDDALFNQEYYSLPDVGRFGDVGSLDWCE